MSHVDENTAYYERIRSGDCTAIDEMILGNLPLAEIRLRVFLKEYRRFRHLRDDLYGEAILALTQVVNSYTENEVDKPTGYIVAAIDHALKNYVDTEIGAGQMSRNSIQRHRSSGQPLPNRLPFHVADPPARLWRNASGHVVRKQINADDGLSQINADTGLAEKSDDAFGRPLKESHADAEQFIARFTEDDASSDLLDSIMACCESAEERAIVDLRRAGYTDEEIAVQLGLSRQTVNRRRKAIEDQYERMKKARSE